MSNMVKKNRMRPPQVVAAKNYQESSNRAKKPIKRLKTPAPKNKNFQPPLESNERRKFDIAKRKKFIFGVIAPPFARLSGWAYPSLSRRKRNIIISYSVNKIKETKIW
jgi:hypothetical protein